MSTARPPAPASPRSTASAHPRSRRSRRSARPRRAPRFRRPGLTARSRNAATASRARSCRLRRCSQATRVRRIPTSTTRCPATSAAAAPMPAFAKRSSRPRSRARREADMTLDHPLAAANRSPSAHALSRRGFLRAGAAAGGGLMLSLSLPFAHHDAEAADGFAPNAFIRIEPDGQIVLTMPYVEMGQGTYTSIPMLIAEELEVDLQQVRLEHAPPNEKLYANPMLGVQATGNSNAIRGAWKPLREAGAA